MSIPGAASPLFLGAAAVEEAAFQIDRSLRFNSADSANLTQTFSSDGDRQKWTFSFWIKRSKLGTKQQIFGCQGTSDSDYSEMYFDTDDKLFIRFGYTSVVDAKPAAVFRDVSAWYHIVIALDTQNSTANDRLRVYVNGTELDDYSDDSRSSFTGTYGIGRAGAHKISGEPNSSGSEIDGYLAEVNYVNGSQLAPTDFGEYDDNNNWNPKDASGLTFGTNGFHLDFSDNTSTTTIAEDSSGNNNDFTANNFSVASGAGNDSLIDTPTNYEAGSGNNGGNYCTWNPLHTDTGNNFNPTLSNGSLDCSWRITDWNVALGTQRVSSGKWYWEITLTAGSRCMIGITKYNTFNSSNAFYYSSDSYSYFSSDGNKRNASAGGASYGATFAQGDVIGVALDLDAGTLIFYKNGTSQGTAFTGLSGNFTPLWSSDTTGNTGSANFGQRPFAISSVPTGYKSLCTQNLPDPTIADGSTVFDAKLWTGTGSSQSINTYNFSPDLVWAKGRSAATSHDVYDIIRGSNVRLRSNGADEEVTRTNALNSFDSNGFTVGADPTGNINQNGVTMVGWAWDAGTSTVSNTDGSITSNVRANASAGFSVVSYTGNATQGATIGHGLNAVPEFMLVKRRDFATYGIAYHKHIDATAPEDYFLRLFASETDGAKARANSAGAWFDTAPTSSVFTVSNANVSNASGATYIAYIWAPVSGYSATGLYTGNGSSDGGFNWCGFRPRFVMYKESSNTGNWNIHDTSRNTYNQSADVLFANLGNAETDSPAGSRAIDVLANGFKIRGTDSDINTSAETYVWIAFAEHPFKTARAR